MDCHQSTRFRGPKYVPGFRLRSAGPWQEKGPRLAGPRTSLRIPPRLFAVRRFSDESDLSHTSTLEDRERIGDRLIACALVGADVHLGLRILDGLRQHVVEERSAVDAVLVPVNRAVEVD